MKHFNVGEAKTHLSRILAEVEATGEPVSLMRNGKPVAEIVPVRRKKKVTFGLGRHLIKELPNFNEPITEEELKDWGLD